ncbi:hypothetical protein GYMLUDRAFT_262452 [Collybiopsis luxurians FD-317 M1]|uniref:Uncharacterized protein n=1 Tax=Collybiopsis luxurians FD-317 M1 TaxID=944289 RepID=A0A0D0B5L0_9AGAR|nr:hypothetical protein GYMLUDRAFT_262452 [Collybiopsis luxurians FD-317 M1]
MHIAFFQITCLTLTEILVVHGYPAHIQLESSLVPAVSVQDSPGVISISVQSQSDSITPSSAPATVSGQNSLSGRSDITVGGVDEKGSIFSDGAKPSYALGCDLYECISN